MQLGFFSKLAVVAVLGWSIASSLPNVLTDEWRAALPSFMPQDTLNLGLDLQGGSHLVLQVDTAAVVARAYENAEDALRRQLREANVGYTALRAQPNGVLLTLRDAAQLDAARAAINAIGGLMLTEVAGQTMGQTMVVLTETEQNQLADTAVRQTVEVLRTRVDAFGVAEPLIQRQGSDRVIVELPGIDDVERAKNAIGKTAQLTFHLVNGSADPSNPLALPAGHMVMEEEGTGGVNYPIVVVKRPALTGENLTRAGASFDQMNQPAVDIAFDSKGTRIFGQLSTENVGRRFAIVLDGTVLSAPVFREAILGGRAQISGNFNVQESQDLATLLNAGALPAPVTVVEERTIGPSLGADSISAGMMTCVVGLGLVFVFMVIFYGVFGVMADVALIFNLTILLAVMTGLGFTLTLPGIAGIVLTIGMAVDANVLIFERIREETAKGAKAYAALTKGFEGALATIWDANLTTLVAAIILFLLGTGPVKGFAVTLTIGIAASMFTAILLTRWQMQAWMQLAKPKILKV
ncbi:MAG: protein translocase subunit SecD [Alphaproteobacteria bacterium]